MKENYIILPNIIRQMHKKPKDVSNEEIKTGKRKLFDIFELLKIDKELFKEDPEKINSSYYFHKDSVTDVQWLIDNFTNPSFSTIRKMRNKKYFDVDVDGLKEIVKRLDNILELSLDTETYIEERNWMLLNTRYPVIQEVERIKGDILKPIEKDIESFKSLFLLQGSGPIEDFTKVDESLFDNYLQLNDTDRIELLRLYWLLLSSARTQWLQIVEAMDETRTIELTDLEEEGEWLNSKDTLKQAIRNQREWQQEIAKKPRKQMTDDERNVIEDILNKFRD